MTENAKPRVLVVDDERKIRNFLQTTLSSQGYAVYEAKDGAEAIESSVSAHPDAIILDLGLPDIDGVDVTRRIRERSKTPIIILSVREQRSEKILALDAGADDYLTKPFDAGEMIARLRAVLRRILPTRDHVYRIRGLTLDVARRTVEVRGKPIRLTPTEYEVLKTLVMYAGRVATYGMLLQQVWDKEAGSAGSAHLVRVTVNNLRDKIEPNPDRPALILTEPGVGYRFVSDER